MAVLEILEYPDPRLRTKAAPVTVFDAALGELIDSLLETMYAAPGIGLAATQVDVHQRVLVVDVSEDRSAPYCLVNPRIVRQEGSVMADEGCLSVPEVYEPVSRAEDITVAAEDRNGKPFEFAASGLLAICIQHEMDHLEGKLFVDYLSQLKRERVRKKLTKARKRAPLPAERGAPSL